MTSIRTSKTNPPRYPPTHFTSDLIFFHSILYYFHIWNPWNLKLCISASCMGSPIHRMLNHDEGCSSRLSARIGRADIWARCCYMNFFVPLYLVIIRGVRLTVKKPPGTPHGYPWKSIDFPWGGGLPPSTPDPPRPTSCKGLRPTNSPN